MANIKISELEQISTVENDDILPIVDSSATETKKILLSQLREVTAYDTLPVGAEVDYDGETVPSGWTEITGYEEVDPTDYITLNGLFTINNLKAYKIGSVVFINYDISGTVNKGETTLGTCSNKLIGSFYGSARAVNWNTTPAEVVPATIVANSNGALRLHTSSVATTSAGSICIIVND